MPVEPATPVIRDSWMKLISLLLALMLWLIIKLSAELRYSSPDPVANAPARMVPSMPTAPVDRNATPPVLPVPPDESDS